MYCARDILNSEILSKRTRSLRAFSKSYLVHARTIRKSESFVRTTKGETMKRTILSAAAICAIAVGFALPSTSFAATQMAHGDQPGWFQTNIGNTDNGSKSILGENLDFDRTCGFLGLAIGQVGGNNSCHQDQNNGPWTGDQYNYQPGQGR